MTFLLISRQKANLNALDFIDCHLIQLEEEVGVMKSKEVSRGDPVITESRDNCRGSPLPHCLSPCCPSCMVPGPARPTQSCGTDVFGSVTHSLDIFR